MSVFTPSPHPTTSSKPKPNTNTPPNTPQGFTIVELLIVIVVIAILAAISVVAYNGIQNRANNVRVQSDIKQVANLIEIYYAQEGNYPSTGGLSNVYSDANCAYAADATGGQKTSQWVPGISETLPQNPGLEGAGATGGASKGGCYLYSSNGTSYILSAWNAKRGGASTDAMYRRIGFRESGNFSDNYYTCNLSTFVGYYDFYKNSYTVSNVTSCNETPPSGS